MIAADPHKHDQIPTVSIASEPISLEEDCISDAPALSFQSESVHTVMRTVPALFPPPLLCSLTHKPTSTTSSPPSPGWLRLLTARTNSGRSSKSSREQLPTVSKCTSNSKLIPVLGAHDPGLKVRGECYLPNHKIHEMEEICIYFKVKSRHPVRAGQHSPRPRLGREVPSRRKEPIKPSPHSKSCQGFS